MPYDGFMKISIFSLQRPLNAVILGALVAGAIELAIPSVAAQTEPKPVPKATPLVPLGPGAYNPPKLSPSKPASWTVPISTFQTILAICDTHTGNLIYRDTNGESIAIAVVPNGCSK